MAENAQRIVIGPIVKEGDILGGAKLWHYEAGLNSDKDIWEDRGKEIPLEQPLVADANGYFNFFADGLYKFIITEPAAENASELVIYTWDNFSFADATDASIDRGDAVNSASTVPIGPGYWQHILGSVNITGFSGVLPFFWAVFDGNPILTHSSNLILPGSRNRSMKTGDVAFFLNEGNGAWRMAAHMEGEGGYIGRQGSSYAATATLAVPTDGDFADVGGADVDITAIAPMPAGYKWSARFTGSGCQLIHNASAIICPYSTDYRTVTNEVIEFRSLGAGQWIVGYRSGPSVATGVFEPILDTAVHDGFLHPVGTAVVCSRYRSVAKRCIPLAGTLGTTGTSLGAATFDNATDTWTRSSHGLINGDIVHLTTSGGLPTGYLISTVYFVVQATTDTFKLSLTFGGTPVDGTTNGTGTQTVHNKCQIPDARGRVLVALDNLGGSPALRITSASTNGANASTLGGAFGAQTHTLTGGELPAVAQILGAGGNFIGSGATEVQGGSGAGHSNTQPSMAVGVQMRW